MKSNDSNLLKRVLKSRPYENAVQTAQKLAKSPEKVKDLILKVENKAAKVGGFKAVYNDVTTMTRLVKAWVKGDYRKVSAETIVMILAALVYFLMPFDLVPDILVALGLTDDAAVIAYVVGRIRGELEKFRAWEADAA